MKYCKWIEHKGVRVFHIALASNNTAELAEKIAEAAPIIRKEPLGSLCCIADVKNGHFNPEIMKMLKKFTEGNKPHIKMTVMTGIEGLQRTLYDGFIMVTRRKNLVTKDNLQEALDFLAELNLKN